MELVAQCRAGVLELGSRHTVREAVQGFFRRWYVTIVFALWVFAPELRRVVDWQVGFSSLPIINLIPLIALVPGFFIARKHWGTVGKLYRSIFVLWSFGFMYAFLISIVTGNIFAGIYDVVGFVLPAAFGFLLAAQGDRSFKESYERTAQSLIWIAGAASVYGIYQYIAPPAWDVFWVQNANLQSIGDPVPFGLRIFGPLNAPGPFADFLTLAILANLPRLQLRRALTLVLTSVSIIALLLTLVRTDWIGLVIAAALYFVVTPKRASPAKAFVAIAAVFAVVSALLIGKVSGSQDGVESVTSRLTSFGSLQTDSSYQQRTIETRNAFAIAAAEPLGQGAGTLGTAAKLSSNDGTNTLDNGYLSRFFEMGYMGFGAFLLAVTFGIVGVFQAYTRGRDPELKVLVAFAVSVQVCLLWFEVSGDHHGGISGLFFWYSVFIGSRMLSESREHSSVIDRSNLLHGAPA